MQNTYTSMDVNNKHNTQGFEQQLVHGRDSHNCKKINNRSTVTHNNNNNNNNGNTTCAKHGNKSVRKTW